MTWFLIYLIVCTVALFVNLKLTPEPWRMKNFQEIYNVKCCRECPALKFRGQKQLPVCRVTKKEIKNIDEMECK